MEPAQLRRGREFQTVVQNDYKKNSENKGDGVEIEEDVTYKKGLKRTKGNYGGMDILIDDSENDYVMIMEIKERPLSMAA